ncbi:NAD(P)H-hydrate dehydratase [uncultured Eubacterium sp.]|uniref:NAD(P)H-hydrate dehydratase n=1 Tax=uncultured Eubacterium sp. TaxID=165185 RepID=UPI000E9342E8|nr:NAD(P)H-hydrate dehydratase [uncultured Eubacterium sp.]HAH17754.1 bifunctional ADP-dependent NAD(P)H-hydrate dehydratase/NAD(P)H-hydrate epimerase [Eubacterium sp.]HAV91240.1 bifunctional ADP-dependent NAD(P)H-hydrate dehydratase/NAD(P)H-hydrate epimerase [Eubacterium sp.]
MERVITGKEAKFIDEVTINEIGIPSLVLMEKAALCVFNELKNNYYNYLIVCGSGNNGADGVALARMLYQNGENVTVLLISKSEGTTEFKLQLDIARKIGVEIIDFVNEDNLDEEYLEELFSANDCIVDAILGIGLDRQVSGLYFDIIGMINECDSDVYAIDIPSGICADNGEILGTCINATVTVTFGEYKIGQIAYPGKKYVGELIKKDIGFLDTEEVFANYESEDLEIRDNYIITSKDLELIPDRIERSNKGTYGKLLVIAGSKDMSGAAFFTGMAAYRMGAGLVNIVTSYENIDVLKDKLPEAVFTGYNDLRDECEYSKIEEALDKYDCIVIGPGISTDDNSAILVEMALESGKNIVIDADAINVIASDERYIEKLHENCILTPHMGEMSRLIKRDISEISDSPFEMATFFRDTYNTTIVLKDANTIIATSRGDNYINVSGNEGMSTAGSGDVLSGIIGGLMCIGANRDIVAPLGVYIHGLAGDYAKEKLGSASLMARDILENISEVLMMKDNL